MSEDGSTLAAPFGHFDQDVVAQAAMYRVIIENTIDLIILYNADHDRIYVSPSSVEIFGFTPQELIGKAPVMMIHPEDFVQVHPAFEKVGPACPDLHLTFRARRKDGVYIWIEGQYRYLVDGGGSVAVLRDVTSRKQAEEMRAQANAQLEAANRLLQTLANQDGLTGLANRRYFDQLLDQEFRRARRQELPLAVLMIDVDSFKAYNDRYGHLNGDDCLRRISRSLDIVVRRPGDLAARYGGEEFVVLLPATDIDGAVRVAEEIRLGVSALGIVHLDSVYGVATVSIGASALPLLLDEYTADELIYAADCALYEAKTNGRNQVQSRAVAPRVTVT